MAVKIWVKHKLHSTWQAIGQLTTQIAVYKQTVSTKGTQAVGQRLLPARLSSHKLAAQSALKV